jgi:hypothetical protein
MMCFQGLQWSGMKPGARQMHKDDEKLENTPEEDAAKLERWAEDLERPPRLMWVPGLVPEPESCITMLDSRDRNQVVSIKLAE